MASGAAAAGALHVRFPAAFRGVDVRPPGINQRAHVGKPVCLRIQVKAGNEPRTVKFGFEHNFD